MTLTDIGKRRVERSEEILMIKYVGEISDPMMAVRQRTMKLRSHLKLRSCLVRFV